MFFKKFRSRSKSSSQSIKHSITRIISTSSSGHNGAASKVPEVVTSPAVTAIRPEGQGGRTADEERDYQQFLAKAKKDEEKAEKRRLKEIKQAEQHMRQVNMSPWASRM